MRGKRFSNIDVLKVCSKGQIYCYDPDIGFEKGIRSRKDHLSQSRKGESFDPFADLEYLCERLKESGGVNLDQVEITKKQKAIFQRFQ